MFDERCLREHEVTAVVLGGTGMSVTGQSPTPVSSRGGFTPSCPVGVNKNKINSDKHTCSLLLTHIEVELKISRQKTFWLKSKKNNILPLKFHI